jgi:hypothetical protein
VRGAPRGIYAKAQLAVTSGPFPGREAPRYTVNRPARKLKNVEEKLARKQSRKRAGRKAKAWKKAVETYKPLAG